MPFNGSGVYSAPAADFPAVTQTVISSTHFNNVINDIATALSLALTKDGQQVATANIPFGGFRATNVGITAVAGSVATPAINVSDTSTGLYRSAVSELAVSIAGTQRARFDATGLIVTGTVNASTSVVTPLVGTDAAVPLALKAGGSSMWSINNTGGHLTPVNAGQNIGDATHIVGSLFTPIIDSGTNGSLSLRTNNGQTGLEVSNTGGTVVNWAKISPAATGNRALYGATGSDTDVGVTIYSQGAGGIFLITGTNSVVQFEAVHTALATRHITVTGSNGGNPTIGVTAGNLAITPSVVIAGALSIGSPTSSTGNIGLPSNGNINSRNNANSADLSMIAAGAQNSVNDIIFFGATSSGVVAKARSGGAPPTTSDLLSGQWAVWRDTGGATTKLYYNNAGAIQSVALA